MEKNLEKQIDETFRLPGVSSVLFSDDHGLCLGVRGNVPKHTSGPIATLASQANTLSPVNASTPVVYIESEAGSVLIKKHDNLTAAVFKSA